MQKKILVIEDNELNLMLFGDLLEDEGYSVVKCPEGDKAYGVAKECQPDLILMDINLPGMSGYEIVKLVKADDSIRQTPVLAVTASVAPSDIEKMKEHGCDGYIAKPISVMTFLQTVSSFVG